LRPFLPETYIHLIALPKKGFSAAMFKEKKITIKIGVNES